MLEMYVDDVDKSFAHAVDLGGTPLLPPTDMFFGERYCWVGDPWGHVWALATVKDTLTDGEVQRGAEEFMLAMAKKQVRCLPSGRKRLSPFGHSIHVAFGIARSRLTAWEQWLSNQGIAIEFRKTWKYGGEALYFPRSRRPPAGVGYTGRVEYLLLLEIRRAGLWLRMGRKVPRRLRGNSLWYRARATPGWDARPLTILSRTPGRYARQRR